MHRVLLPLAVLLLSVSFSSAHTPPFPTLTCQAPFAMTFHDYLPPSLGTGVIALDGSVQNCGAGSTYDGELDHGYGGAVLFAETGDGFTYGVAACFGAPSIGHHTSQIYAMETLGWGPAFVVAADYSHAGAALPPADCGDGVIEPCGGFAGAYFAQYLATEPDLPGCNPADVAFAFPSAPGGASGGGVSFGPGINGAYVVFLQDDFNAALFPQTGHVWTA